MEYYTVYQITNQINGKIYIGVHKTSDLDDNYMGSGSYLGKATEKYGLENFTKEILFIFDNPNDMYVKEAEIVNEEFLMRDDVYNVRIGGYGGWDYVNRSWNRFHSPEFCRKISPYGTPEFISRGRQEGWWSTSGEEQKRRGMGLYSPILIQRAKNGIYAFTGKKHTSETKKKMSEKAKVHSKGSKNSQYGTMWIYNKETHESMKIKKDKPIPAGWLKGRKMRQKDIS